MRKIVQGLVTFSLGLALLAAPSFAAGQAVDLVVEVDPRNLPTIIDPSELLGELPPGATIVSNGSVLRGTLERNVTTGEFSFTPTPEFWSLGTDRFLYTAQHPTTGETSSGVVMLVGLTPALFDSAETFEDPTMNGSIWAIEEIEGSSTVADGRLTILGTIVLPNEAEGRVQRDHLGTAVRGLAQGGKTVASGGGPPPQPPPGGGGAIAEAPWSFTLLRGAGNAEAPFWVDLRPGVTGDDVRLAYRDAVGGVLYGDWRFVGLPPHEYQLTWWETGGNPKVLLWVDRALIVEQPVATLAAVDRFEMGVLTPHPVTGSGLRIDDIGLYSWGVSEVDDRPARMAEVAILESLEDGSAAPLVLVGAAQISSVNALNGTRDLVFDAVNGQSAKVEYQPPVPTQDSSWNARFRLRVDSLQIPALSVVTIAKVKSSLWAGPPLRVELRKNSSNGLQVRVVAKSNEGADLPGPWGHLPPTPANLEVQWWTPRSASFDTGGARLWVNTALRSEVRSIKNHGQAANGFELGVIDPAPDILGFARFDTLQTWKSLE